MASPETVRAYNEETLALTHGTVPTPLEVKFQAHPKGSQLTSRELTEAADGLAEAFPQDAWDELRSFTSHFTSLLEEDAALNKTKEESKATLETYLRSDDPMAARVREYLGPDMDPSAFAAIIVNDVRAMTSRIALRNQSGTDSMTRVVLSSVANDMTKRRYMASVLFFAGRCCYCSCTMSKEVGPTQATGEHLTPLNPDTPGAPVGVTRYGNMALACKRCNDSRANKDLESWLATTKTVKDEDRAPALARIKAFRRFALYEDYSPEQSQKLREAVEHMRQYKAKYPRVKGALSHEDFQAVQSELKGKLYDLQSVLSS